MTILDDFEHFTDAKGDTLGLQNEIDGVTYVVGAITGRKGLRLSLQLTKLFGEIVGGAGEIPETEGSDAFVLGALKSLAVHLDEDQWMRIVAQFAQVSGFLNAEGVFVPLQFNPGDSKNATVFDTHFAGRIAGLFKWLVFAFKVNFSDFLDMVELEETSPLAKVIGVFQEAKATPSSPQT